MFIACLSLLCTCDNNVKSYYEDVTESWTFCTTPKWTWALEARSDSHKYSTTQTYVCTRFQSTIPGLIISYSWKIIMPSARSLYSQFTWGFTPMLFIQLRYAVDKRKKGEPWENRIYFILKLQLHYLSVHIKEKNKVHKKSVTHESMFNTNDNDAKKSLRKRKEVT